MNIGSIRDELALALTSNISGLRAYDTIPDQVNPPCAIVRPASYAYDVTMGRGTDEAFFDIQVIAGRASERAGQDTLDTYLASSGATSVKAALESDTTLNSTTNDLRVIGWGDYSTVEIGGIAYLTVTFSVHVVGAG